MTAVQLQRLRQQRTLVEIELTRLGIAIALDVPLEQVWPEAALIGRAEDQKDPPLSAMRGTPKNAAEMLQRRTPKDPAKPLERPTGLGMNAPSARTRGSFPCVV